MNGSIKRVGMVVLAVAMVASAANAATLFNENFENMTIGETVSGNTATTVAGSSWAAWGSFFSVSADPTGAAGNVLKYQNTNSFGRLWANFGGNNRGNIVVEYDFYIPTFGGNPETYPVVVLTNDYTTSAKEIIKTAAASSGNSIVNMWNYKSAAPGHDAISTDVMLRDHWYRVKMQIPDYSAQTSGAVNFNLTVTDLTGSQGIVVNDQSFTGIEDVSASTTEINMMLLAGLANTAGANSSYYYLDNISVETIPEPMTMALMGVGGIAFALRRKK